MLAIESVAVVVPLAVPPPPVIAALVRFVHVVPPSVLICHWKVGVGLPDAATVKVAVPVEGTTVKFDGEVVTWGAAGAATVSVKLWLAGVPIVLLA